MSYCYSFNEETFHGQYATVEESLDAARDEASCNGEDPAGSVWVGEERHPTEWITPARLGESIHETLSDWLTDEVGEVAENFVLKQEQLAVLGQIVLTWIESGPGFRCWGVKNIQQLQLSSNPQTERDTQTIDMFGGGA